MTEYFKVQGDKRRMKVTNQETVEQNVVKLTIEIDKETFAEGMNRA